MNKTVVSALYKFVPLNDYVSLREPLQKFMETHQIKGSLLLAREGINGTVAGSAQAIEALYGWFDSQPGLENISHKESFHKTIPFNRTKVKLKKEIVTMGVENIDPLHSVGTYVEPENWNQLISDENVTVIDTRNDYEVKLGTFQGATNPKTTTFREFPEYVKQHLNPEKNKKIAMFCTGGIRCEKSTAYLKGLGFEEVYHLKGGILKYLEEVPQEESLWNGECFVFDERVSVDHALQKGSFELCHACRFPISESDRLSEHFHQGVSCPHCIDKKNETQRQRYMEREKQNTFAKTRGEVHIGGDVKEIMIKRKQLKRQGENSMVST